MRVGCKQRQGKRGRRSDPSCGMLEQAEYWFHLVVHCREGLHRIWVLLPSISKPRTPCVLGVQLASFLNQGGIRRVSNAVSGSSPDHHRLGVEPVLVHKRGQCGAGSAGRLHNPLVCGRSVGATTMQSLGSRALNVTWISRGVGVAHGRTGRCGGYSQARAIPCGKVERRRVNN